MPNDSQGGLPSIQQDDINEVPMQTEFQHVSPQLRMPIIHRHILQNIENSNAEEDGATTTARQQ